MTNELVRLLTGLSGFEQVSDLYHLNDGQSFDRVRSLNSILFGNFYSQVVSLRRDAEWGRQTLGVFKVEGYQVKQLGRGQSASNDFSGIAWKDDLINAIKVGAAGALTDVNWWEGEEVRAIKQGFLPVIASGDYSIFDIAAVINSDPTLTRDMKIGFASAYRDMWGNIGATREEWVDNARGRSVDRNAQWWAAAAADPLNSDINPVLIVDKFLDNLKGDIVITAGLTNDHTEEFQIGEDQPRQLDIAEALSKSESMLFWLSQAFTEDLIVSCDPETGDPERCREIAGEADDREEEIGRGVELLPISDVVLDTIFAHEDGVLAGFGALDISTVSLDEEACIDGDDEACARLGLSEDGIATLRDEMPTVHDRIEASSDLNLLFYEENMTHDPDHILSMAAMDAVRSIAVMTDPATRPARLGAIFSENLYNALDEKFDYWYDRFINSQGGIAYDDEQRAWSEDGDDGMWSGVPERKKEMYREYLLGDGSGRNSLRPLGGVMELGPPQNIDTWSRTILGNVMRADGYDLGRATRGEDFYPILLNWLTDKWGLSGAATPIPDED